MLNRRTESFSSGSVMKLVLLVILSTAFMVNAASDNFFKRIISNSQYYTGIQFAPGIPENKYSQNHSIIDPFQPTMPMSFSVTKESMGLAYGLRFGLTFPQSAFLQEGSSHSSNKSKFKQFIDKLQYSLGVGVYQSVDNKVEGEYRSNASQVNPDADYKYTLSAMEMLVEFQATYPFPHNISAFTRLGFGLGDTKTSGASVVSTNPLETPSELPTLSNASSSGLAYKLTLGGEYILPNKFKDWSLDVGYSFGQIGAKGKLGVSSFGSKYPDYTSKSLVENRLWLGVNYKFG